MTILSPRLRACALLGVITAGVLGGACNKSNPAAPSSPDAAQSSTSHVFVTGTAPVTGASSQFTATAVGADGTQTNVTTLATWRSTNQSVVTVGAGGLVQALAAGATELSATYNGVTGSTPLIVSGSPCSFSVSPTQAVLPGRIRSTTITVNVVQGQQCQWSAQANGFLRIEGPSSGTGSGSIVVTADENTGGNRMATVAVAGTTVTVFQSGASCVTAVTPLTQSVSNLGGSFTVNVTAPTNCAWMIESPSAFVILNGPLSRTGTQQVTYQIGQNHGADSRTALMFIESFTLTITQAGAPASGG